MLIRPRGVDFVPGPSGFVALTSWQSTEDKKAKTSKGKPAAVKKKEAGLIEFDGDTTDECGQQITWHSLSVTSSLLSMITIFK